MFDARFAVFARTASVLPTPSQVTRNLSFFEVSTGADHRGCFNSVVSLGLVRVCLNFPLNDTCTNMYAHVAVVRERVLRTLCSVCAYGARVAHPKQLVICRFLRFHRRRHVGVFKLLLNWTGRCWFEFPTEWNLCKRVRARGGGA